MPDNEILLLLHEKRIELIDLIIQKVNKLSLCLSGHRRGRKQPDQLLQFLIGQILISPTRQRCLNLPLQPFPKLHWNEGIKMTGNETWFDQKEG